MRIADRRAWRPVLRAGQLSLGGGRLKNHAGNSPKWWYDRVIIAEHTGSGVRQSARRSHACGARLHPWRRAAPGRSARTSRPGRTVAALNVFHTSSRTMQPRASDVRRNRGWSTHSAGKMAPMTIASAARSSGTPSSGPLMRSGQSRAIAASTAHHQVTRTIVSTPTVRGVPPVPPSPVIPQAAVHRTSCTCTPTWMPTRRMSALPAIYIAGCHVRSILRSMRLNRAGGDSRAAGRRETTTNGVTQVPASFNAGRRDLDTDRRNRRADRLALEPECRRRSRRPGRTGSRSLRSSGTGGRPRLSPTRRIRRPPVTRADRRSPRRADRRQQHHAHDARGDRQRQRPWSAQRARAIAPPLRSAFSGTEPESPATSPNWIQNGKRHLVDEQGMPGQTGAEQRHDAAGGAKEPERRAARW